MTTPDFSAGPQTAGYLFQARHALLLLLGSAEDAELVIEGLDDVELDERSSDRLTLTQLKHHIRRAASLTDSAPDVWRTIRIWATHVRDGSLPSNVALAFVTTATASSGSAMSLLRETPDRNVAEALRLLRHAANNSANRSLAPAFQAFNSLSEVQQSYLLERVTVQDESANLVDVSGLIRSAIRYSTHPSFIDKVQESLEGWWFAQVAEHIVTAPKRPIARVEVHLKLASIAERYHSDDLPINFATSFPEVVDVLGDQRLFVSQVREVTSHARRIERCIVDYYRAYEQRSRWLREELLLATDLSEYEERLVDEWERNRIALEDAGRPLESNTSACVELGQQLLTWMETTAEVPIRARVTEGFVMRGSFHMLANEQRPRVWWHPYFLERLQQLAVHHAE